MHIRGLLSFFYVTAAKRKGRYGVKMQDSKQITSLSVLLRNGTAQEHQAVEGLVPFFQADFKTSDYQKVLLKLLPFFEKYEASLKKWNEAHIPDFQKRLTKSESIIQDLKMLGAQAVQDSANSKSFLIENKAQLLGAMYVIEGSSLGGQVISERLKKLGIPEEALHFYSGYGSETRELWLQFKKYLDEHSDVSEQFSEDCILQAKITFQEIGKYLA